MYKHYQQLLDIFILLTILDFIELNTLKYQFVNMLCQKYIANSIL